MECKLQGTSTCFFFLSFFYPLLLRSLYKVVRIEELIIASFHIVNSLFWNLYLSTAIFVIVFVTYGIYRLKEGN